MNIIEWNILGASCELIHHSVFVALFVLINDLLEKTCSPGKLVRIKWSDFWSICSGEGTCFRKTTSYTEIGILCVLSLGHGWSCKIHLCLIILILCEVRHALGLASILNTKLLGSRSHICNRFPSSIQTKSICCSTHLHGLFVESFLLGNSGSIIDSIHLIWIILHLIIILFLLLCKFCLINACFCIQSVLI